MTFTNQPPQSITESIHYDEWLIKDFKIVFLFSERILTDIRKRAGSRDWFEDPVLGASYIDQVHTCFTSITKYYQAFGSLPQVGDRLYDQDTGMLIQERSIDGGLMTITFTLSI